eukprot:PhM_4_TR8237/c0_g1_i1/m.60372
MTSSPTLTPIVMPTLPPPSSAINSNNSNGYSTNNNSSNNENNNSNIGNNSPSPPPSVMTRMVRRVSQHSLSQQQQNQQQHQQKLRMNPQNSTHNKSARRLSRFASTIIPFTSNGRIPVDCKAMRAWYVLITLFAVLSYVTFTLKLVHTDTGSSSSSLAVMLFTSFLFGVDAVLHWRFTTHTYEPYYTMWLDFLAAMPTIIVAHVVGADYNVLSLCMYAFPALKVLRVNNMFGMSLPDLVDSSYINFYYRVLPSGRFVFWCSFVVHTLVISKMLCSHCVDSYHSAITWVWIVLTSSPFEVASTNTAEDVLAGVLMGAALVLQGYVIGAISMLVFSYNVKDEDRRRLLEMMATLKFYQLPEQVQHEVLSFQYHVMEDSSLRSNSVAFDSLPPSITREIVLHVKVQILNKVSMLHNASTETKLELAATMEQVVVAPDVSIIVSGEVGECMYFLVHGLADVCIGSGLVVATLRRGDFFGEVALLDSDSKRKATVTALTYCDLLCLHRQHFDDVASRFPQFAESIQQVREARRACHNNNNSIFSNSGRATTPQPPASSAASPPMSVSGEETAQRKFSRGADVRSNSSAHSSRSSVSNTLNMHYALELEDDAASTTRQGPPTPADLDISMSCTSRAFRFGCRAASKAPCVSPTLGDEDMYHYNNNVDDGSLSLSIEVPLDGDDMHTQRNGSLAPTTNQIAATSSETCATDAIPSAAAGGAAGGGGGNQHLSLHRIEALLGDISRRLQKVETSVEYLRSRSPTSVMRMKNSGASHTSSVRPIW